MHLNPQKCNQSKLEHPAKSQCDTRRATQDLHIKTVRSVEQFTVDIFGISLAYVF